MAKALKFGIKLGTVRDSLAPGRGRDRCSGSRATRVSTARWRSSCCLPPWPRVLSTWRGSSAKSSCWSELDRTDLLPPLLEELQPSTKIVYQVIEGGSISERLREGVSMLHQLYVFLFRSFRVACRFAVMEQVRPGGLLIFQEMDTKRAESFPPSLTVKRDQSPWLARCMPDCFAGSAPSIGRGAGAGAKVGLRQGSAPARDVSSRNNSSSLLG